jgi:hypothetical protein
MALYGSTRPYTLHFNDAFEQVVVQVPLVEILVQHIEPHRSEPATHGMMFGSTWSNWAVAMVGEAHGGTERGKELLHAAYTDGRGAKSLTRRRVTHVLRLVKGTASSTHFSMWRGPLDQWASPVGGRLAQCEFLCRGAVAVPDLESRAVPCRSVRGVEAASGLGVAQ